MSYFKVNVQIPPVRIIVLYSSRFSYRLSTTFKDCGFIDFRTFLHTRTHIHARAHTCTTRHNLLHILPKFSRWVTLHLIYSGGELGLSETLTRVPYVHHLYYDVLMTSVRPLCKGGKKKKLYM